MSLDKSRILAVQGLVKVENSGFSNLVFSSLADNSNLDNQEKAFSAQIFYGSIERKLTLNYILQKFISKPIKKLDKEVVAILQTGLYQIIYMNSVPSFAAINQAVSLCPFFKKTSAKGLVNAVLRKAEKFSFENENFKNDIERLSITYSVDKDIIKILKNDYENECEDILKSFFNTPHFNININTSKISKQEYTKLLDDKKIKWENTPIDNCLRLYNRNSVTNLVGFKEGYFFVQGFTSQYTIHAADIQKNQRVLDLCAAPGGKSFAMGVYLENTGEIYSCDPNENRLELIKSGAERLGFENIKTICNKGEKFNNKFSDFDVVLCDVPCSGIGIISKKPDLRYKSLEKNNQLVTLQYDILQTASNYVKIGGKIVYSTCTINKAENENVVIKFLENNKNFKILEHKLEVEGIINNNEMITFLPNRTNYDGFFMVVMEKVC